jgi:hypothetical protein
MKPLSELEKQFRESRAHTYASENADHYRGFDAGQLRAAESLQAWLREATKEVSVKSAGRGSFSKLYSVWVLSNLLGTTRTEGKK